MKNKLFILIILFLLFTTSNIFPKIIVVDKSGLGQYTSIQAGINAATPGDTVKVYPGIYNEQVNISSNIVLQGSGYENTQIVANTDPAVSLSSGKIMWVAISSNTGRGVTMSGGILTNCIVWNCPKYGIDITGGNSAIVQNDDLINNYSTSSQVRCPGGSTLNIINTIVWNTTNKSAGYFATEYGSIVNEMYCVTSNYVTGSISSNPQFVSSTDFKLNGGSPCIDTGKPDIYDPDGSRSDMGYYGGPDAPVFPVVTNLRIYLNSDGTVNVQATAESRY